MSKRPSPEQIAVARETLAGLTPKRLGMDTACDVERCIKGNLWNALATIQAATAPVSEDECAELMADYVERDVRTKAPRDASIRMYREDMRTGPPWTHARMVHAILTRLFGRAT